MSSATIHQRAIASPRMVRRVRGARAGAQIGNDPDRDEPAQERVDHEIRAVDQPFTEALGRHEFRRGERDGELQDERERREAHVER